MSLFKFRMEDTEGAEFNRAALITEGDEGESVAAAIAELVNENAELEEAENEINQQSEALETIGEVQEVLEEDAPKMEHTGLSVVGSRLAAIVLGTKLGKRDVKRTIPKMEDFSSRSSSRESTKLSAEGLRDSLRNIWQVIKTAFNKAWAKAKTWYVKCFNGAKRLADRAKAVRDRAESMTTTIDNKSFNFSQVAVLSVNGKLKTYSEFKSAFDTLNKAVEMATEVDTDSALDKFENTIDGLKVKDAKNNDVDANDAEKLEGIVGVVTVQFTRMTGDETDAGNAAKALDSKLLDQLGAGSGGDKDLLASPTIPGDKIFVVSKPKDKVTEQNRKLRATGLYVSNSKYRPKEIGSDADAATLTTSQMSDLCDAVISRAGDIYEYQKKWQKVEKAQDRVIRKIDEIAKDIIDSHKDDDTDDDAPKKERAARTYLDTLTDFARRIGTANQKVINTAMPVYAAVLNWCEGSMSNYKKA